MNIQAIMRQAQSLQKEMLKTKEEIDKTEFIKKNGIVTVKVNGKKEILNIKIDSTEFELDDIEVLEDMVMVCINLAFKDVDNFTESKMQKYSNIPGIF